MPARTIQPVVPVRRVTRGGGPLTPLGTAAAPTLPATPAATDATASAWAPGRAAISGSGLLFLGYLLLVFIEYTGLPQQVGILKVTRFASVLSYSLIAVVLVKTSLQDVFASRATKLLIGFLVFTILSFLWAFVQLYAIAAIRPLVDYLGFMLLTATLLDRRSRMGWFCATFSVVAMLLVLQNLEKLTAGGKREGHFLSAYFMGDGNDFAWWMALTLPLTFSLVIGRRSLLMRAIGLAGTGACLLGVVGTQSRGAFIGIAGAFLYGWLFVSRKKAVGAVLVGIAAVGLVIAAPSGYFARMNTVTEYKEDNSARARIQAWTASLHMAMDHPLGVGAGNFASVHGRFYLPSDENNQVGWGGHRWANAHSIYFKVLGEYGFLGLGMLLAIIATLLHQNYLSRRLIRAHPDGAPFDEYWPAFLNMSTIAFAVCGIFLGGFNYPHIFVLTGLSIAVQRVLRLESTGAVAAPSRAAAFVPPVRAGVAGVAVRRSS